MRTNMTLAVVALLLGTTGVYAASQQGPVGGVTLGAVRAVASGSAGVLQLARNGADDPANHDFLDDRNASRPAHHRRHRGLDDGPNHDANDDHGGRDHSGSGKSGSGDSGAGSSGSGKSGSGKSGSGNS